MFSVGLVHAIYVGLHKWSSGETDSQLRFMLYLTAMFSEHVGLIELASKNWFEGNEAMGDV